MNLDACRDEALDLMRRLESEPEHVLHVANLAMSLFDQLQPLHQLGVRERVLLECAAWLHDIGWSVAPDGKGHHRESARLIREHAWQHCPRPEVELVAMVSRYHRKSAPTAEHEDFVQLAPPGQRCVRQLAALIRLADALDRSHTQRVTAVEVSILPQHLCLSLASERPLHAEEEAVRKKGDVAEHAWGRALVIERARRAADPAGKSV
ncbi:MAG: HD domain-containing protein [Verrucomicrobia bacterium]|nr:HD domain-containing protein [Verrucomicrobiota bacterium]